MSALLRRTAFNRRIREGGLAREMTRPTENAEWISVAEPPPPYTIVQLSFEDGSVRRAVWNGKMWWGYDERVKRACELYPARWRMWPDARTEVSRVQGRWRETAEYRGN